MTKDFKNWCESNSISYSKSKEGFWEINDFGSFIFVDDKEGKLLDDVFLIILTEKEQEIVEDQKVDFIVYKWGTRFFYTSTKETDKNEYNEIGVKLKLNDFKNIGKYEPIVDVDFVNLGVHTGYELLNGSCEAFQYADKAKYLGHDSLGLAEKNTLAGTIAFQSACLKNDIKPVLGYTVSVAYNYDPEAENQELFDLKFYVKNEQGWKNVLRMNKAVNVDNEGFLIKEDIKSFSDGLICVFPMESYFHKFIYQKKNSVKEIKEFKSIFKKDLYFQIDLSEFIDDGIDIDRLKIIRKYMKSYSKMIKPVYISDAYYVDEIDSEVKGILNSIDRKANPKSSDQYLKTIDQIFDKNISLFESNDRSLSIFLESIDNTRIISDACNYQIDTGNHKLPKFEVKDPIELYNDLLAEAFEKKVINKGLDVEKYWSRLEEENEVIVGAGFVDYFLILWDVIEYSKANDILVGVGRGSAGGSLVAYLLGIIEIDPIEYNLLFERFLNKTRVSGERAKAADALPDIDLDFEGKKRDEIKRYIEHKYGSDHVCSIGTFNRMKVKSIIKDFARVLGVSFQEANSITKKIDPFDKKVAKGLPYEDIFDWAMKNKTLKAFVQKHIDLFELIKAPMNQQRSSSIHASAVIITPKEDKQGNPMTIYEWMPVRKIDGVLVSEWEGKYIDKAGFLKEDILGIAQLDKFRMTLELIKENIGETIDLNEVDTKHKKTFKTFQKGMNEDVFQFGTGGLKKYSIEVKPTEVEDLISMNALYRPGPMKSDAHNDFVRIRRGRKKAKFDIGMEVVTEKTFGLYVYQEQVMQAMVVGGMTLSEADQVRTYMKKFDDKSLQKFKKKFVKGYSKVVDGKVKKPKSYATEVWDKLYQFSSYGFNRSHAAAYSVMGYWSQWLKVNYPLEFWTASLNFVKHLEDFPNRISEMRKLTKIKVAPPDINKSDIYFTSDTETNNIYWSFEQIKQVGPASAAAILNERKENGQFYDMEEFLQRIPKRQVNKRVVTHLILAGAFDELCIGSNNDVRRRLDILKEYYELIKTDLPEEFSDEKCTKAFYWKMRQRELTGFADLSFDSLLARNKKTKRYLDIYKTPQEIVLMDLKPKEKKPVLVAGLVLNVKIKNTSKGDRMANITMDNNNNTFMVTFWSQMFEKNGFEEYLAELGKREVVIAIKAQISNWKEMVQITNTYDTSHTKIIELT